MKLNRPFILLAVFTLAAISAFSQNRFFADVSTGNLPALNPVRALPQKFRALGADVQGLRNFLWALPAEEGLNRSTAPVLTLPMPDGTVQRFRVWESSMQEPGLAAKFPDIKTFTGQGIDDPYATVKLDFSSSFGFHAQILTVNGDVIIDPYQRGNLTYYISFYRKDYTASKGFVCHTNEEPAADQLMKIASVAAGPCRGNQIYTYRLAVACTGEYAIAVGGTTPAALHAAIVTTVNRVNGVYKTELAIRLILVANNNLIEFMDPATDPFNGNNSSSTLINESQSVITSYIGSANFDVGHTFSTGGGGLAGLGVVCNNSAKARGITGRANPVGDPFDIDYVAHEIGHQFGGSHTFNSLTSSCNGNRSGANAYEVGSGTTIQAYAGICGSDNIQPNSDPYFHARSYDQMTLFIEAGGASCRGIINTGNNIPQITGMSNASANIPLSTPFTLTGTATDADGDALTYSWEGWDLGPGGTWSSGGSSTTAPLFKSRIPKTTGSRTFPDMAVILANYPANPAASMNGLKGETLPTVGRTMKFRLTVRDNRAGGGGVTSGGDGCQAGYTAIYQINAISGTGPFIVTAPNGGESYPGGSVQNITWNVAGTNAAPINTSHVRITLSVDGGLTYPYELAASTPNDGTEALALPSVASTQARVRIEAVNNVYFDISNQNFSITAAVSGYDFSTPAPLQVACNTEAAPAISLGTVAFGGYNTPIVLSATGNPAGTSVIFGSNPLAPGNATSVSLSGANTLQAGTYNITVTGTSGSVIRTRTISFVITANPPQVLTQPLSQTLCAGTTFTVGANANGAINYQWQISTNGGANFQDIPGQNTATYTAGPVSAGMNNNRYRVVVSGNCGTSVISAAAILNVVDPVSINTHPVSTAICQGSGTVMNAGGSGTNVQYQWQRSTNGGQSFENITGATAAVLNLDNVSPEMNGYQYRALLWNPVCTTPQATSASILTVYTLPVVNLTAAPYTAVYPGLKTTITATASPATGIDYTWFRNGNIIQGAQGNTISADVTTLGDYRVRVEDANGCSNVSNVLRISDSSSSTLFIYPNPNRGQFTVSYYNAGGGNTSQQVLVYDAAGSLYYRKVFPVSQPYQLHPVVFGHAAQGVYLVVVKDAAGKTLATSRILVQ